jgi:hypothetical protein
MKPTKRTDRVRNSKKPSDDRTPSANLDKRYGRIGISAVAAAVRCKGDSDKRPATKKTHAAHYESD